MKYASIDEWKTKTGHCTAEKCCDRCRWFEPDYENEGFCSRASILVDWPTADGEDDTFRSTTSPQDVCKHFKQYKPEGESE